MIDRYNYEEYFLLYVDKELDQAQRAAVESFVQQNPDLSEELEMLKHATLTADKQIEFGAKDFLYKNEAGISLENYEEYFLLSIDNELNDEEEKALESFILKHPQVQEGYTLLQQTTLPKELIAFEDKSTLYRSEKKQRRLPLLFIRMSVAASVIGIIATLFILSQNSTALKNKSVATVHQPGAKSPSKQNVDIKANQAVTSFGTATLHKREKPDAEVVSTRSYRRKAPKNIKAVVPAPVEKNNEANLTREPEIAVVQPPNVLNERLSIPENTFVNDAGINDANLADKNIAKLTSTSNAGSLTEKSVVKKALYNEVETEEEDNSLYIGAAEFNKTKLKGILRKAVNFFDKRTTKSESDRTVQIASFQIKGR